MRDSAADALVWYIRGSAYLYFDEHRSGSLEPVKLADLVVLGGDPLLVLLLPDEIQEIRIEETAVGGRTVYGVT